MESISESHLDIFRYPARIIIAGYSNSGKSTLVTRLVNKYLAKFSQIIICGVETHPLQAKHKNIIVSRDIINPNEYTDGKLPLLYILDDVYIEAIENKFVLDIFTKGRHLNMSCILITQNLFFQGKYARSISLNASHYILLRNRDLCQLEILGRQIYGREKAKDFVIIYKRAIQESPFGYLLVDLSANIPEVIQLRTHITHESAFEVVYTWS